jgi:hypothetical protein
MNIKKIIREEIESSDWDWVKDSPVFKVGKFFDEDDLCFDSGDECRINITDDSVTFNLEWDFWRDKTDLGEDNSWYVEPLLYHGTNYDGGGDYYEFDSEEFNYTGYKLTQEQTNRFQDILNITNGKVQMEDIKRSDNMLEIFRYLKYKPLQDMFDSLITDYLDVIGYTVQKNRWLSISTEMKSKIEQTKSEWDLNNSRYGSQELTITVPMNVVWEWYSKGINDLSTLLYKVSEPITEVSWYDWFYEEWDTSGGDDEISDAFNTFLDKAEEFLEDEDLSGEYKNIYKMFDDLDVKPIGTRWNSNLFERDNPDGTKWIIEVNFYNRTVDLKLFGKNDNRYSVKPRKNFNISINELPQYLNNYSLDL